jgi:predicted amidohydrolase YtcJ
VTEPSRPLVIANGKVFTADRANPWAEAVAMEDGVVRAVGRAEDVLGSVDRPEVVDAGGHTVVPGFIDAHNHFLATGESLRALDVRYPGVRSVADLARAITEAASSLPPGEPVHAYGYDAARYDRLPTCRDLDAAAPGRAVYVGHVSGHAVLVNSAAMAHAGVGADQSDPAGGRVDRDETGRPTGVFHDAAMSLVQPTVVDIGHHGPNFHVKAEPAELLAAVETAGRAFVAAGLTTVCDAQVTMRELSAYREAARRGSLFVRTVCMPLSNQLSDYERLGLAGPFGNEWLSLGPMKFYCDGSLIGGTAAFSDTEGAGLQGEAGAGILYWEPGALESAIARAHGNGWQIGVHAQGDRAIEVVLDGFDRALATRPTLDPRFRIEHAGYPTDEQLQHMRRLGVIMVTQPSYLRDSGDDFLARFGERALRFQPVRSALDAGVRVVVSSDSDVASYRPLETIASAVERRTRSGAAIGTDQTLTVEEAVWAHTADAAFALRAEQRLGSLSPGKLADVTVIGGDLFASGPDEIRHLPVDLTVMAGRIVHAGPGGPTCG